MKHSRLSYPRSRQADVADDYHGTRVADPYRWLEDPDSPESRAWIEEQNRLSESFLAAIPERAELRRRLTRLFDHERLSVPLREGGRTFWVKNRGLDDQPVLYVQDRKDAEPRVLLDPNALSADGTVGLVDWRPSPDGRLCAYALSSGGSDWLTWRFRDVETGLDLADRLSWVKFSSVSFTGDGLHVYYSRYDQPPEGAALTGINYHHKLMRHRLGEPQELDRLVYHRPEEKEWGFQGEVSDDGRHLVVQVWRGSEDRHRVLHQDLTRAGAQVTDLVAEFAASYDFLGNDADRLFFLTDLDAPRSRVIALDVSAEPPLRIEVVPEAADVLEHGALCGGELVLAYLKDATSEVRRFALDGTPKGTLELPGLGAVAGLSGKAGEPEAFFQFQSFTRPAAVCRLDLRQEEASVWHRPRVDFDPSLYQTRQVFVDGKDGTKVPVFVTAKKDLARDGERPALLHGYGGFRVSLLPQFSPGGLLWMERGGVYAVANLRGGGEYGEPWHRAGTREKKQNVFDDFIAVAEWLCASGLTSPKRLAIAGASNGGLLVGACLAQRPDLFAAALPDVGVFDLLRFQKFTIGWAWISDYGTSDDAPDFAFLKRISPLHNLVPGERYPATLITTSDHDDRVVPAHSFKFAAALQAAQGGDAPVLIRIGRRAGHGLGKPTSRLIEETADRFSFLIEVLRA